MGKRAKIQSANAKTEGLIASFWKKGKFAKFTCSDCQVNVLGNYSEIILRDASDNIALFIVSDDPDIEASMTMNRNSPGCFDGFQLRDLTGKVVEQITVADSQNIH